MKKLLITLGLYSLILPLVSLAANDCGDILDTTSAQSTWVSANNQGELVYRLTARGDRIMDFSYAGYGSGGVAFPKVPTKITLQPSGQDDTAAIQAALDKVSSMAMHNGFRGQVMLSPGVYSTSQVLRIKASGVVLSGSGSSGNVTQINLIGEPHTFLEISGSGAPETDGKTIEISDAYVPSGAMQVHVTDTQDLHVGDTVLIRRPVTSAWVQYLDMGNLCANCNWLSTGKSAQYDRVITAIDTNQKLVSLDAPIPDSLDKQFTHANLVKYKMPGRIEQIGLEHVHVNAPEPELVPVPFTHGPTFLLLKIAGAQNVWAQDVLGENFVTGVVITGYSKWITLQNFAFTHNPPAENRGAKQFQYSLNTAEMVLCNRCTAGGDNTYSYVTGMLTSGPNVILNSRELGKSRLEPHMRWATGLLVDGFSGDQGGWLDFMSRGAAGSGHGWTMAWGVIWNSVVSSMMLQQAPGTMNWVIGSSGNIENPPFPAGGPPADRGMPNQYPATIESFGSPVSPKSLYLAQLCVRKGRAAVSNLGY